MYKSLIFLALLATSLAQSQNNGDLESIINQIFGTPSPGGQQPPGPGGQQPVQPVTPSPERNQASTIVPPGISDITNDTSCTTEAGEVGECVRYYLCNKNGTIVNDGVDIIDIRVQGPCKSYLDSCCLLPDRRDPTDPITPRPTPIPPIPDPNGNGDKDPNGNGNTDKPREGCGWRNPNGVGFRTVGDVNGESKFGEFPWMVAILKTAERLNVYVGGGSLIHPSVVLTAAHYVAAAKELRVRAGEWDTWTTKEIYPYQDRDVKKIEIHKDFNKGNLFYDIAVQFLSAPIDPAPNVGVVCLPPARERAPGGARCFTSGWGKDKFGKEGRYQAILKKVEVPVVERNTCQTALRKTRLGRFFELHTSFMCAGGEPGADTCKGDGGSPLVCPIEFEQDRYQQNGIVAWGIGCGEDGTPGVYVDVANLREWIDDKVKGQGYTINGYSYTV